jgi:hypothetical protein
MVFSGNGKQTNTEIEYDNQTLENVKSYKYLGILFTCSGKFSPTKNDLYKRGLKATFKLMKLINSNNLNYQTAIHLFDHTVKPVLMYGSEVWAPLNNHNSTGKIIKQILESVIEKCHLKFCRFVLGVGKKAPNMGLYGETGRKPLYTEAFANMIKYWHTINNNKNKLVYQALQENLALRNSNKTCWTKSLNDICTVLQLDNITENISKEMTTSIASKVKHKIALEFNKTWTGELQNDRPNSTHGNKLRTYRRYKLHPTREKYLEILNSKAERSIYTKFRLSAHKLDIERLRYTTKGNRIPPEQRICRYCTLNEIEDETHFLMVCPLYDDTRLKLITAINSISSQFHKLDNTNKLIWCLSNENNTVIKETASFLKSAFNKRDESREVILPHDIVH